MQKAKLVEYGAETTKYDPREDKFHIGVGEISWK